jgi:NADPH-dependent 2,4-dienoyl-CoA reductase/sulfur reductase-like enzyme
MCTHYGAPLATGIIVDDTVRCPWHHACFSLRTGAALRAPALDHVTCWKVETRDGKLFVRDKEPEKKPRGAGSANMPENVVIVGGGAAGNAAAEMLRREGYRGGLNLLSADDSVPYDRPTLSKDFLNGSASQTMVPLRSKDFYKKHEIELLLKTRVGEIDLRNKVVRLAGGKRRKFDALLLATGAELVKLKVPGRDLAHVCYLRSQSDCRTIIAKAGKAKRIVYWRRSVGKTREIKMKRLSAFLFAVPLLVSVASCSATGIGAGVGAGGGALVGSAVGHPWLGALVGGAGGAVAGHEIGESNNNKDK